MKWVLNVPLEATKIFYFHCTSKCIIMITFSVFPVITFCTQQLRMLLQVFFRHLAIFPIICFWYHKSDFLIYLTCIECKSTTSSLFHVNYRTVLLSDWPLFNFFLYLSCTIISYVNNPYIYWRKQNAYFSYITRKMRFPGMVQAGHNISVIK